MYIKSIISFPEPRRKRKKTLKSQRAISKGTTLPTTEVSTAQGAERCDTPVRGERDGARARNQSGFIVVDRVLVWCVDR